MAAAPAASGARGVQHFNNNYYNFHCVFGAPTACFLLCPGRRWNQGAALFVALFKHKLGRTARGMNIRWGMIHVIWFRNKFGVLVDVRMRLGAVLGSFDGINCVRGDVPSRFQLLRIWLTSWERIEVVSGLSSSMSNSFARIIGSICWYDYLSFAYIIYLKHELSSVLSINICVLLRFCWFIPNIEIIKLKYLYFHQYIPYYFIK